MSPYFEFVCVKDAPPAGEDDDQEEHPQVTYTVCGAYGHYQKTCAGESLQSRTKEK